MATYLDGIGNTLRTLPEYKKSALMRQYERVLKARDEHRKTSNLHNSALLADIASGLLNIIARRKGSRTSLPVGTAANTAPYFMESRENLRAAERDYKGLLAKEILFAPQNIANASGEVREPTYVPPVTTQNGGFNLPKPSGSWNKVLEKWRREKMITPRWYQKTKKQL